MKTHFQLMNRLVVATDRFQIIGELQFRLRFSLEHQTGEQCSDLGRIQVIERIAQHQFSDH